MTRATNARLTGFTMLIYFAAGIAGLMLAGHTSATGVLALVTSFSALVLAVTFYGEIYFAVGSTLFSWLLLRGRMIPVALAWLGVIASAMLVVLIPLQLAGLFGGARAWSSPVTWAVWLPLLVFELTLAAWLIVKGVAAPARRQSA